MCDEGKESHSDFCPAAPRLRRLRSGKKKKRRRVYPRRPALSPSSLSDEGGMFLTKVVLYLFVGGTLRRWC